MCDSRQPLRAGEGLLYMRRWAVQQMCLMPWTDQAHHLRRWARRSPAHPRLRHVTTSIEAQHRELRSQVEQRVPRRPGQGTRHDSFSRCTYCMGRRKRRSRTQTLRRGQTGPRQTPKKPLSFRLTQEPVQMIACRIPGFRDVHSGRLGAQASSVERGPKRRRGLLTEDEVLSVAHPRFLAPALDDRDDRGRIQSHADRNAVRRLTAAMRWERAAPSSGAPLEPRNAHTEHMPKRYRRCT